jgi:hypothetical protein
MCSAARITSSRAWAILEERLERARLYARRRDAGATPEPAPEAPAPEAAAVEEAGAAAAASSEPAPIVVPGRRSGRRVRAEIDSSVWGG